MATDSNQDIQPDGNVFEGLEPSASGTTKSGKAAVVFRAMISPVSGTGEVIEADGVAWAEKRLGARTLQILRRVSAQMRRHISQVTGIKKSQILPAIATQPHGCSLALILRDESAVPEPQLGLAKQCGAWLAGDLVKRLQALAGLSDPASLGASTPPNPETKDAPGGRATARPTERAHVIDSFIGAFAAAGERANGGQLSVAVALEEGVLTAPCAVVCAPPAMQEESIQAPWKLTAVLLNTVSRAVMRVRDVRDDRVILVSIEGCPEALLDLRLLAKSGPVVLTVAGDPGGNAALQLISIDELDTNNWVLEAPYFQALLRRLEVRWQELENVGLLPTLSSSIQTTQRDRQDR